MTQFTDKIEQLRADNFSEHVANIYRDLLSRRESSVIDDPRRGGSLGPAEYPKVGGFPIAHRTFPPNRPVISP